MTAIAPEMDPGISIWLPKATFTPSDFSWQRATETTRRAYWKAFAKVALEVKDVESAAGIGKDGQRLHPIAYSTYLARGRPNYSPMGRSEPSAPTLTPTRGKSRLRSYLKVAVLPDSVVLYWKFDPHTRHLWGVILARHKTGYRLGAAYVPPRDTIGISPFGQAKLRREADRIWSAVRKAKLKRLMPFTQALQRGEVEIVPIRGGSVITPGSGQPITGPTTGPRQFRGIR